MLRSAEAGADGVKVDAQAGIGIFGVGRGGGSALAQACVQAMEKSVKSAFTKLTKSKENRPPSILKRIKKKTFGFISRLFSSYEDVNQDISLEACMCHSTGQFIQNTIDRFQ
jgi:HEPN domain-containing protein